MLNAKPGLVYTKFINLTEEEKEYFYDAPAYISGFDFSIKSQIVDHYLIIYAL